MKRFWTEVRAERTGDRYTILLDNRPMRLPGGPALPIAGHSLAEAVAAEWQEAGGERGGEVAVDQLPLTRLAATAELRIAPDPAPVAAALARYGGSDALCYRALAPEELAVRQHHAWQPWLDWAAATYGARLHITNGIMPITQDPEAVEALHAAVLALSPPDLAGLGVIVPVLGSLVLGLAIAARRLPAAEAYRLSVIDELYQEELWGEDEEAAARRRRVGAEVEEAARFMALASEP